MPAKPIPKPRLRKGSKTYEVREVIAGKARTRTLGTTDYREALRRFPDVYAAMLAEFENTAPTSNAEAPAPVKTMPLAEASRRYAESLIASEECYRREHGDGMQARHPLLDAPYDPVKLAREHRQRLQRWLAEAQSRFTVRDYQRQEWFLRYLAGHGGDYDDDALDRLARRMFPDYGGALRELARTGVRTIREMIAADEESGVPVPAPDEPPKSSPVSASDAPPLSEVAEVFIAANNRFTDIVRLDVRAVVRDLLEVVGDKPVDRYTKADGRAFRDVLTRLPSNRHKKSQLRGLSIKDSIEQAEKLNLPKIAPKTLITKRGHIARVFAYAAAEYDNVFNPFESNESWSIVTESAANQWEPFTADELGRLLSLSTSEPLWWLIRLGLYTGARLGELCQLTGDLIRVAPVPHIYFAPSLRLKRTASVRSVPVHAKLIDLGFMDFAESAGKDRLFPDIRPRKETGRLSHEPSKDFVALLIANKLKRKKLSYHSLRHNWTAEWKRTHLLDTETRERLIGHAVGGVAGRYGGSYEAEASDMQLLVARAKLVDALRFDV